jgi:hypothetical protein
MGGGSSPLATGGGMNSQPPAMTAYASPPPANGNQNLAPGGFGGGQQAFSPTELGPMLNYGQGNGGGQQTPSFAMPYMQQPLGGFGGQQPVAPFFGSPVQQSPYASAPAPAPAQPDLSTAMGHYQQPQVEQQPVSFEQWRAQPRMQTQEFNTPERQLQKDQAAYQNFLAQQRQYGAPGQDYRTVTPQQIQERQQIQARQAQMARTGMMGPEQQYYARMAEQQQSQQPDLSTAMGQIKGGDQFAAQNTMRQLVGLPPLQTPAYNANPTLSDAQNLMKSGDKVSADAMMRQIVGLAPAPAPASAPAFAAPAIYSPPPQQPLGIQSLVQARPTLPTNAMQGAAPRRLFGRR